MFFTVFFNFGEFAENFVGEKPQTRQMASMRPTSLNNGKDLEPITFWGSLFQVFIIFEGKIVRPW